MEPYLAKKLVVNMVHARDHDFFTVLRKILTTIVTPSDELVV